METQTDLMKKGLRHGEEQCHQEGFRNTDRPDEEGIKTAFGVIVVGIGETQTDLMKKGLRRGERRLSPGSLKHRQT